MVRLLKQELPGHALYLKMVAHFINLESIGELPIDQHESDAKTLLLLISKTKPSLPEMYVIQHFEKHRSGVEDTYVAEIGFFPLGNQDMFSKKYSEYRYDAFGRYRFVVSKDSLNCTVAVKNLFTTLIMAHCETLIHEPSEPYGSDAE